MLPTLSPAQESLRHELRNYFQALMTPELQEELLLTVGEGGGPLFWIAMEQLGRDGWIGLGWPQALGGRGFGRLEQFLFVEEVMRAGFPFPFLTTESVGPELAQHASPRLRELLLPQILTGKLIIAIGYSAPAPATGERWCSTATGA